MLRYCRELKRKVVFCSRSLLPFDTKVEKTRMCGGGKFEGLLEGKEWEEKMSELRVDHLV